MTPHPMDGQTNTRPIVIIAGPTAGGKTSLAITLAQVLPGGGECVSADSMQVYKGMDIGTAKPTAQERAAAAHHMIDVASPRDPWTLDDWLQGAEQAIEDIRARDHWPIVVGGTNLYLQALLHGLMDGPPPDPEQRAAMQAMPEEALWKKLHTLDPEAAARIHPNDRRRMIRALEYVCSTGQSLTNAQTQWAQTAREDALMIILDWPAEMINRRINRRVHQMMDQGFLEEVTSLLADQALGPQTKTAVGYAQLIDHLQNQRPLEEAIEQIKIRTRRFGKQQRTWLRRFQALPASRVLSAPEMPTQDLANKALAICLDGHHPD